MEEETVDLDEVVAIGYVSQKKALMTGAIQTMNVSENLKNIPTVSAGNILAGSMAGLDVSTPTGDTRI